VFLINAGPGIQVELVLAVLATLLWNFLPDGPFRSACFIIATASWITSLFLNISPFMRFDGYYLLSDFLDIPNLQDRSFALGKWFLRKMVLGLDAPSPEYFKSSRHSLLITYAFLTWVYRLFVFTAIALTVYHMFFKVLGITLFAVEIAWFIVLPITRELNCWWGLRAEAGFINRNVLISCAALLSMLALFFLPWNSNIQTSGIYTSKNRQRIYPPYAAQIKKIFVQNGQKVNKDEPLFELDIPQLRLQEKLARKKIHTLETQLNRQIAHSELLTPRQVIIEQITAAMTELAGLKKISRQLIITSPINGTIADMDEALRQDLWINESKLLCQVVTPELKYIEGYIEEEMLAVVKTGNQGIFYGENLDFPPLKGLISKIYPTSQKALTIPYLASIFDGQFPVTLSADNQLVSHTGLYKIIMTLQDASPIYPNRIVRGKLVLKGQPESMFNRMKKRVMAVIIRESGF